MNTHLANTFDLADYPQPSQDDIRAAMENAQDLEKTLKDINGFDTQNVDLDGSATHDAEMDEISEMAVTAHRDLLEVGMNVDTRTAGEILGTSATMLKIALDARNSKMDKKLRLIKLQMDKMKLDHAMAKEDNTPVDGGTLTMDRNELIAQIQNATKNR
jgi:hypothetical protein